MRSKKHIFLIFITTLLFCLSSCGNPRSAIIGDTAAMGEERFQEIITTIEDKNTEDLESLFSKNALKGVEDFNGDANYLFDFFQGDVISKKVASVTSGSKNNGERTTAVDYKYTVTTNENKYIVFFTDVFVDTENPDNVGLYMLQIIKESDREEQFDWGGDKTKCAGIYRPQTSTDSAIN